MKITNTRSDWEEVILLVVLSLEKAGIRYHVDASSSLYVHGVEFEMEDLDLTVEWGAIHRARELFLAYHPGAVNGRYPPSFTFSINSKEVHVMSYESVSGVGSAKDRTRVKVAGTEVWSKTIEFYKTHMTVEHKLWKPLNRYLNNTHHQ